MRPESPEALGFVTGLITVGYLVVSLFFLRFWRRVGDRLFLAFGGAFALLAAAQPIPLLFGIPSEFQAPVYLLRLAAFGLIIVAIVGKNLKNEP